MNYWVYFNSKPVPKPADLVIFDDAHLAEQPLSSAADAAHPRPARASARAATEPSATSWSRTPTRTPGLQRHARRHRPARHAAGAAVLQRLGRDRAQPR